MPDEPLTIYQRHLPHWRQAGATYFVTFRLGDSLPQNRLNELKSIRREWLRRNPPPRSGAQMSELWQRLFVQMDRWLDQGMGSCRHKDARASRIMAESLRKFDGERYEVGCFTVMPNHVHVVVRPFDADEKALERVTHSWKRYTSREINRLFDLKGSLWQDESYDRIIRDEEHLWNTLQYIGSNSRKAELSNKICPTWISPSWVDCGWRFVDEDEAIGIVK